MGRLTSLVYRASGRNTKVADPTGHLLRWRDRAPCRRRSSRSAASSGQPSTSASPAVRPALAATMEPVPLRQGLEQAVDRAVAGLERLQAPTSRWWSLLGLLQTLAAIAIAVSAAWVVLWILARPIVDTVEVPIIGSVPMPFAALLVSILVGYLLARLLGLHAGWVGRRWAAHVRDGSPPRSARRSRNGALPRSTGSRTPVSDYRRRPLPSSGIAVEAERQQFASAKVDTFWKAVSTSGGGLATVPDWAAVVSHVPMVWTSPLTESSAGSVDHSVTTALSSLAVVWSMFGQSSETTPAKSSQKPVRSPVPMLAGMDGAQHGGHGRRARAGASGQPDRSDRDDAEQKSTIGHGFSSEPGGRRHPSRRNVPSGSGGDG